MKNNRTEWSGKSRGGSFGYRFFVMLIRRVGIGASYSFLSLIVVYFIPFAPKATRAIWRYNRHVLKYGMVKSALKLYSHYYVFGQTIIDKIAINSGLDHKYKFEFGHYEQFIEQLDQGAVIIIGGHVGCWEIGSQFFGDYSSRLNIVMFDGEYHKIKEVAQTMNTRYKIIAINEGGIESLLRIKQAVDGGEYVCFQGDRFVDKNNTCSVRFLGHDALFPLGPSLLASKFKTPVVFYFAMRESGRRYRFKFSILESGLSQKEILAAYVEKLEQVVKEYPQQWFNFFDLWKQR
ncbi:MAG: acyltransferase [Mucinivorans sp.]